VITTRAAAMPKPSANVSSMKTPLICNYADASARSACSGKWCFPSLPP
jgi:hypothetical protein